MGILGWRGKYLTRSVRSVPLMAAEDLPTLRQFVVVCGGLWWFVVVLSPPGVASTRFW